MAFSPFSRRFLAALTTRSPIHVCVGERRTLTVSVTELLQRKYDKGEFLADQDQLRVSRRLSILQLVLEEGYTNAPIREEIRRLEEQREEDRRSKRQEEDEQDQRDVETEDQLEERASAEIPDAQPALSQIPRGFYIHGQVGTGKSMLMDMFFRSAPTGRKRRVHFHAFMQSIHQSIHELKKADLRRHGRNFHVDTSPSVNPIRRVAQDLASQVDLLCFDEFQVTDVADAMILKQLFEVVFHHGTIVVATSNRPPQELYEDGINRSYFVPFIDLLQRHCIVLRMKSGLDYRVSSSRVEVDSYFWSKPSLEKLDHVYLDLSNAANDRGRTEQRVQLDVAYNRTMTVNGRLGVVAMCSFEELCLAEVGAAEYRAIAQAFPILILTDVPALNTKKHNEARRFITLMDELYEHKCALLCATTVDANTPQDLFGKVVEEEEPSPGSMEYKVGKAFGIDAAQSSNRSVAELASVRELSFAFRRAASRMTEMCSITWWKRQNLT